MKITEQWLKDKGACPEGMQWFLDHKLKTLSSIAKGLIKDNKIEGCLWLFEQLFSHKQNVLLACFSAKLSLKYFEKQYPMDKRPRLAIEAALRWAQSPTEENRSAAWAAVWSAESAARSAAESAGSAAWAAVWSAESAAGSARSAAESAGSAAWAAWAVRSAARSAAWAAARSAAWAARSAAESAESAGSAAESAGSAAWAAVWVAAGSAAWAARSAAESAESAGSAAWAAARSAESAAGSARSAVYRKIILYGLKLYLKDK